MKITTVLSLALPLCAGLCGCPEDDYIPPIDYRAAKDDLVFVEEDKTQFTVGDTLWIAAKVPESLETDRGTIAIYELNGAETTTFSLNFEQNEGFELPSLLRFTAKDLVADFGAVKPYQYDPSEIVVKLERQEGVYVARFGIKLLNEGDFLLSEANTPYNDPKDKFNLWFTDPVFNQEPVENVIITTSIRQASAAGKYAFKVVN